MKYESFIWTMSPILCSFADSTLGCLLSNWVRFNRQWSSHNSKNCSGCICPFFQLPNNFSAVFISSTWQVGSVFSSSFFNASTGVPIFIFIKRKCAGVMIWFSRSLSTYTNGLVLITASILVNIGCNWELVRLTLPILFDYSYETFVESSHPRWEFNNEWPFYF